jgi:hypothetical protein
MGVYMKFLSSVLAVLCILSGNVVFAEMNLHSNKEPGELVYIDSMHPGTSVIHEFCSRKAGVLQSYKLVQKLSGPKSIFLARMALTASYVGDAMLPDGSTVADFFGDWGSVTPPDHSLYLVTYKSTDAKGRPATLSGLVVVPDAGGTMPEPVGILVFMHATTTQRDNAPGSRSVVTYAAITAFANSKVVLAMPDYLGYGANTGDHPYALGKLNAPSGRSIIIAARELMDKLRRSVGDNIYITGYSEGGGNAMWLTRYLEERNEATLLPTCSAPMSGPYDLTGATAMSFIAAQPPLENQENFTYKPVLISFAASSMSKLINRTPLDSLIKAPLALQAKGLFPGTLADETLGVRLLTTAMNDLGYIGTSGSNYSVNPRNLMQDALVEAIENQDMTYPGMKLWAENDAVDWIPKTPILLIGVLQDSLVPFASSNYPMPEPWKAVKALPPPYASGNAQNVISSMRKKGINADMVAWTAFNGLVNDDAEGKPYSVKISHSNGFIPSSIIAQSYFFYPETPIPQLIDP